MSSELLFVFMIVIFVAILIAITITQVSELRHRFKRMILDRLNINPAAEQYKPQEPDQPFTESESKVLSAEQKSQAEFEKLQKLIEDRKKIARDADLSHHLWGLYKNHFRSTHSQSINKYIPDGEWYGMKILRDNSQNGLNEFEFELKGSKYKFIDDEDKQGWSDRTKCFSLLLFDDSDRCLIEVPMKVKVDRWGSTYSILSNGPRSFLPGEWSKDFINVKLKNQRIRNQDIRAQKHQERLEEIEDLKHRFGFLD